jgi:hypothetical protein
MNDTFKRIFGFALVLVCFYSSDVLAEDTTATTSTQTNTSPIKKYDTGIHYFHNTNCTPSEFSQSYDECGCSVQIKYVSIDGKQEINTSLKPDEKLEKYCDFDYEGGVDTTNPSAWKEAPKEQFTKAVFDYSVSQEVTFLSEKWLNVVDYSHVFSGGAHGNTAMDSLLFDTASNKLVDIITMIDTTKITGANQAIQAQLNAKPAGEVFEEFLNLEEPSYIKEDGSCDACVYVLKDTGLYAVFQQYGVGPYSSGFIEVLLPENLLLPTSGITFKK